MDVRVSGHQIDTGAALQSHVEDRMQGIVDKYFNRAISSHITLGKGPGGSYTSDIVTHVMQGLILKGHAEAHDVHQAFEQAAGKIEKQLRRYKRRIQDRHEQAQHAMREEEAAYTIFAAPEPDTEEEITADSPPIIAETSAIIPECSVADAVMMLDLQNTNAILFKNGATEAHNMVYRRPDGSIGWVEPR
ncbi:ribosome hibernation-promoting factor, HPF/YfiA family [Qipengyuania gaetbuli]|uniref:ribosome hibernation-promoting factor, HPF/YfiA family n=1 Tax=Qipengyuania gaetbuli TaxID=266952 RepID=UPI001CD5A9A8|nr:ribosome-associated translation inhibitor RaiA [Qipengyuania gaetbuli]MCA0910156.1 ribosome-associated translation inhibitor RaiA [Qipengyuania gaetbuli]